MQATPYQIELLQHTLGLNEQRRESYRNHFVAGHGHSDMRHLEELERAGLMERRRSPGFLADGDIVFAATDAGHEVALAALPEPKPRTRYDDFMDYDSCLSFGEYLCGGKLPEVESRKAYRKTDLQDRCGNQYRMFRHADRWTRDVEGEWCATKKEAKASYKAVLKANKEKRREEDAMVWS